MPNARDGSTVPGVFRFWPLFRAPLPHQQKLPGGQRPRARDGYPGGRGQPERRRLRDLQNRPGRVDGTGTGRMLDDHRHVRQVLVVYLCIGV